MTCNFTYTHLFDILESYKKAGYKFYRFDEYPEAKDKAIFLRHDVEASLENAREIAILENQTSAKSTFFIRPHALFYNPFSLKSIDLVEDIKDLGHEIGIHYEPTIRNYKSEKKWIKAFKIEKTMIELNYGIKINSVSVHEPRKDKNEIREEILNKLGLKYYAYSPKFVLYMKYLSDSSIIPLTKGRWREGCMCRNIEKHKKMQVLIHPVLWYKRSSLENY